MTRRAAKRSPWRPRKPPLTPAEVQVALAVLAPGPIKGHGMRSAATAVSRERGAHLASTRQARRAREVSARWLERELARLGVCGNTSTAAKVAGGQETSDLRQPENRGDQRHPEPHLEP